MEDHTFRLEDKMRYLLIKCPQCREMMEIDTKTGKIIKHHPEIKPKPGEDFLSDRIKGLEEEKAQRAAKVEESRAREKGRHKKYDDLFKKVQKETREGPPAERPLREIDLD